MHRGCLAGKMIRAQYKQTERNNLDDLMYEAFRGTPHKLFQQIMFMI